MKKLVVLMLVLGLVTVANASLKIQVNGVTDPVGLTVPTGSILTLAVVGDGGTAQPQDVALLPSLGSITGGTLVYTGSLSEIDNYVVGDGSGMAEFYNTAAGTNAHAMIYANFANSTAGVLSGTMFNAASFVINQQTTLKLLAGDGSSTFDSVVVNVPEPITMALLGLGGLFIRRRTA